MTVADNEQYSKSVNEVLRNVNEQQPRVAALITDLIEPTAETNMIRVHVLSLGTAARKNLTYKFPHMRIAAVLLLEIKEKCEPKF